MNKSPSVISLEIQIVILTILILVCSWKIVEVSKEIRILRETPPVAIIGDEISHGDTKNNTIILTFDGGSGADSAYKILKVLAQHKIKTTFFLTGKFMDTYPNLVRTMLKEGHEIFSHTYNHPYLTQVSDDEIRHELRVTDQTLMKIAGTSTKPYFRPPYGDRDERVIRIAREEGYQSVYWTIDALDWSVGETQESVKYRIISTLRPGNIYLIHLGDMISGDILEEVILDIQKRGFTISSLSQGL